MIRNILLPGVHVAQDEVNSDNNHVGEPPRRPNERFSYRWHTVNYPSKPMLDQNCLLAVGALPSGQLFYMSPEATSLMCVLICHICLICSFTHLHGRFDRKAVQMNNANWLSAGYTLSDPMAFMQWFISSVASSWHIGRDKRPLT